MPRQAHGRPVLALGTSNPKKKKPVKGQFHNALEIAEQQNPTTIKIRQHRFGEVDDDAEQPQTHGEADERSSKRRKLSRAGNGMEELGVDSGSEVDEWHEGMNDDDEDSDINSDEAFGESDEERFSGFAFRGSAAQDGRDIFRTKRKVTDGHAMDLFEGEYGAKANELAGLETSEESDDEAVDLAQAFDMNEEMEKQEQGIALDGALRNRTNRSARSDDDNSDSVDGTTASDDDSGQESISEVSYLDEDGGNAKLRRFVRDLTSDHQPTRVDGSGTTPAANKITAADLLQYITNPRQRQALKVLANSENAAPEQYRGGVPGKLEPPLAKRQQDRLDRVAAYDKSKETLNRWIDTVKQNRRAEHLSFPLQDPDASARLSMKELKSTSQALPMTSLEATVQQIMQESGMLTKNGRDLEAAEQAFEELQEKQMPFEEVQARRAELRKARDLMFREEIRARRIKKIKSKAYRKVHRKERDKATQEQRVYLAIAGLVDSDEERQQLDRRRAEERMGARHRESKWAKGLKATGRAAWDEDARNGMSNLAKRDEELRRRIEGKTVHQSDESDQDSTSESEEVNTDDDGGLEGFESKLDSFNDPSGSPQRSGLESMAFMQKAQAAKKAANDADIKAVQKMIRGETDEEEVDEPMSIGRLRYGTDTKEKPVAQNVFDKSEFEERLSDEEEIDVTLLDHHKSAKDVDRPNGTISESTRGSGDSRVQKKLPKRTDPPVNSARHYAQTASSQNQQLLDAQTDDDARSATMEDTAGLDLNDTAAQARLLFAGDDLIDQDFNREKEKVIQEEGDQVVDNTLPGWGSWTGVGISKKEQKRAKGRYLTITRGVPEDKRQDAKLDRVIVNEKRVKKNGKYLASELPHPFESRQQYERSLRLPIGPEWTTKNTFQDATRPRVLIKQGIIKPMAKPLA